ncbi:MAG: hypothetical protein P9L93_07725 [Candidatus Gorgyraea atricola]|nr:hypothetical protein [Candidatus Gorgyraea atricola]
MEDTVLSPLRKEFHSLNNWLNKITIVSGLTRHELETKGLDPEKLEDEKKKLVQLLNDFEEYALKIGEIVKSLRKELTKG